MWGSGLELSQGGTSKALAVSSSNSPAALFLGVEGRGEGLSLVPEDWNGQRYETLGVRDDSPVDGKLRKLRAKAFHVGASAVIQSGAGTPNGVVVAAPGSLFLRTDGDRSTTLYIKTDGTNSTGWIAK